MTSAGDVLEVDPRSLGASTLTSLRARMEPRTVVVAAAAVSTDLAMHPDDAENAGASIFCEWYIPTLLC